MTRDNIQGLLLLTFVIAIGALILSWVAFNRTTAYDLEERAYDTGAEAVDVIEEGAEDLGDEFQNDTSYMMQ